MKVSDLIEALEKLDPDYRVGVEVADGDDTFNLEIVAVEVDLQDPRLRVGLLCAVTPGYPGTH